MRGNLAIVSNRVPMRQDGDVDGELKFTFIIVLCTDYFQKIYCLKQTNSYQIYEY